MELCANCEIISVPNCELVNCVARSILVITMVHTGRNTSSSTPPSKRSRASASSSSSVLKAIIAERDLDMNDTSSPALVELCDFVRCQHLTDLATRSCRYHEATVRAFYDNFPEVESITHPPRKCRLKFVAR